MNRQQVVEALRRAVYVREEQAENVKNDLASHAIRGDAAILRTLADRITQGQKWKSGDLLEQFIRDRDADLNILCIDWSDE